MRVSGVAASYLLCLCDARARLRASESFLPPKDALPYEHRGIKLWQIEAFANSYALGTGVSSLRKVCDKFNEENRDAIRLPTDDPDHVYPCNAETPQAYDMVDHLIAPLTDPNRCSAPGAPASASWTVPLPARNTSMAELLNPEGFPAGPDVFMTWSWETEMSELVSSLRRHAESVYLQVNKSRPEDVVFWICAFVLNQHQVGDELNWDLSMAPFRLGLEHAKGAIMLLSEENYGRVLTAWNYYEILVCFVLSKQLWPVGSGVWGYGVLGTANVNKMRKHLAEFNISEGTVDYRTGATDADLEMIVQLIGTTQLGVDGLTNRVKSMIASAVTTHALQKVVDASALLNEDSIQAALPLSWASTRSAFPLLKEPSRSFARMVRVSQPVSLPSCLAKVPFGLRMHILSGKRVRRQTRVLDQTEVTVRCPISDTVFVTSCRCNTRTPDDSKASCSWSAPRPRGEKQSCWPAHKAGELDCLDHPPLPPVHKNVKDLVCDTAIAAILV